MITLQNSGLIFHDNFKRANSFAVGRPAGSTAPNWTEDEVDAEECQILRGQFWAGTLNENAECVRNSPAAPQDYIVQTTMRVVDTRAGGVITNRSAGTGAANQYAYIWQKATNQWQLYENGAQLAVAGDTVGTGWIHTRLKTVLSGGNRVLTGYGTVGNLRTPNEPRAVVQKLTFTDVTPTAGTWYGLTLGWGTSQHQYFIACGITTIITGIPTGWKAAIDNGAPVAEVAGQVSFDFSTLQLPSYVIRVLDGSDVQQDYLSPVRTLQGVQVAGVFGGDTYQYTAGAYPSSGPISGASPIWW